MNCEYCGAALPANASNCPACGAAVSRPVVSAPVTYAAPGAGPAIPNYMVWSILATLCCCLPTGIVAIINSSKVSTFVAQGDYANAQVSSAKAKQWCIYSIIGFVVQFFLGVLLGAISE